MSFPEFVGSPCGHYGAYTFHKGFKFFKHGKFRIISLGEFFFVRISTNHDPCIGELELLWSDQNSDQRLSSLRLYFLPEQTPEGRLSTHGEDEVLMASDKVVLRLDDLVSWITEQVEWNHGLLAFCPEEESNVDGPTTRLGEWVSATTAERLKDDVQEEKDSVSASTENKPTELANEAGPVTSSTIVQMNSEESPPEKSNLADREAHTCTQIVPSTTKLDQEELAKEQAEISEIFHDKNEVRVMVFPYPAYCRYRSVLKRLEGTANEWLKNFMVVALGGFANNNRNTHILFCRDTFDHEELAHHELNCEYLAPTLKVKRRKKKGKNGRSTSPGSESNTSEESKETLIKNNVNNGFKQPPCKTEQEFLQRLYKFMKKRKTPIHRVPHLGFKQIDLFVFFSFAQKLGGYDKITGKRLWKHVYDVLGGDPGSTSAATCTRRHYEKLLLPFERFMEGKEYKPKQSRKQQKPQKKSKDEDENEMSEKTNASNCKGDNEDTYAFTDSNHENSKDSLLNEEPHSGEDVQLNDNYSDDDSKSIWSIQKSLDGKEDDTEKNGNKQIKPLIIQKEQNESFSEKERKWNEIRRKNALARKWVRQLRPSRGGKISGTEKLHMTEKELCSPAQKMGDTTVQDIVKKELSQIMPNNLKEIPKPTLPAANSHLVKQELFEPTSSDSSITNQLLEKFKPAAAYGDNRRLDFSNKSSFFAKSADTFLLNKNSQLQQKSESFSTEKKSWCGYSRDGVYQVAPAPERYPYGCGFEMSMIHSFIKQEYKPGSQGDNCVSKPYLMCGNSSESSVLSTTEHEPNNSETKHNLSQRRPSVIQHTEYVTSPSPSQSPKQMSSEVFSDATSRDPLSFSPNTKIPTAVTNHLAHTMTGKVTEWLAKGVPEAVACKTPCVVSEKTSELHDKVLMPSSCKTPGPGTGKVPMYGSKNRVEPYSYAGTSKSLREKGSMNYRQTVTDVSKKSAGYVTNTSTTTKVNPTYQKAFHPITAPNSLNPYMKPGAKPEQTFTGACKNKLYNSEPSYSQTKRHRLNTMPLPSPLPPRPSLLPFTRQQTYRTSPLSDIPKTVPAVHSDCNSVVLDLSVKKKTSEKTAPIKSLPSHNSVAEHLGDDAVCLDLSVKKRSDNLSHDNAIENISPPLPHTSSFTPKPLKPLPTLIALQDLIREETSRQKPSHSSKPATVVSSPQPSIPISSPTIQSNSAMYAGSAQNKIPPNFITSLPDAAFTKEMAKSLYMTPDPTQFSPYVIPPFYTASWSATNSLSNVTPSNTSTTTASPNSFKEAMSHSVFPKQYMYNFKHQFHPLLCKDNGCYPPSCK